MIGQKVCQIILDFDDDVEDTINDLETEEDIAAEYMDNKAIEQEINEDVHLKRISEYIESPCCNQQCCKSWNEEHIRKHVQDMTHLSKTEKKLVMLTILRNSAINTENTRYSEQRQRLRFTFRYEPFGIMCAVAFRVLFNIRIEAFKGLLAYLKTNDMSIVPPVHGNKGKEAYKSNMLDKRGVTEKVVEFILALSEAQGEFSPGRNTRQGKTKEDKNPDLLWLPACLTRSSIYRMYNKRHTDYSISRTAFNSLFDNEPRLEHIKIRSPRSDMCDFCEMQKRKIAGTKPHDESKAEALTAELAAHQKAYQEERAVYNSERNRAEMDRKKFLHGKLRANECIDHICVDYGQSIGLPYTADQLGGTFFLQMRNFHLFGICSVLEDTQLCYTYDEREAGKGANEVISFFHNFLVNREIQTPDIRIHADNCRGQNKNKYVMWYLMWLVITGRIRHIEFKFMIKGHTHFIVDSAIGHTKRELRRSDVFCLDHWAKVIDKSASKNKAKVVDGNDVYDWKKGLEQYFKPFDGISKFQHFLMDSSEPGWICVKHGVGDDVWKRRKLLKSDKSIDCNEFRNLPKQLSTVGFKGGSADKEISLFENLRQYVKDEWKDEICPDPETFRTPVRDYRSCPDW